MNFSGLSSAELVQVCAESGAAEAWEEFVRRFGRLIATVALRTARRWGSARPELVDELVQETYLKLCADQARLLRSFDPRHPDAVYGYLKTVTANLVHDHCRARFSQKRGPGQEAVPLAEEAGAAGAPRAAASEAGSAERRVLLLEIDVHLLALVEGPHAARDRRIFWLYYRVGLPAASIAALPGIGLSTKGVESTLHRLTRELRERLAAGKPGAPEPLAGEGIRPSESF